MGNDNIAELDTVSKRSGKVVALDFVSQWLALGVWPAGWAWFIWVLVVFDCIAALLYAMIANWAGTLGRFLAGPQGRPARFLRCC